MRAKFKHPSAKSRGSKSCFPNHVSSKLLACLLNIHLALLAPGRSLNMLLTDFRWTSAALRKKYHQTMLRLCNDDVHTLGQFDYLAFLGAPPGRRLYFLGSENGRLVTRLSRRALSLRPKHVKVLPFLDIFILSRVPFPPSQNPEPAFFTNDI